MLQICETPHEGGASRNQLGGWLRDPLSPPAQSGQALPALIALHLGERFVARCSAGLPPIAEEALP
jgi:hypothetical protein